MQAESLKTGKPMSFERPILPIGNKPMSVNTKAAEEVPYGIDKDKGLIPKGRNAALSGRRSEGKGHLHEGCRHKDYGDHRCGCRR